MTYQLRFLVHLASTYDISICCDELDALISMFGGDPRTAYPVRPSLPTHGVFDGKHVASPTADGIVQDIVTDPFLVISLPSFEMAKQIAARAVCVKAMTELWSAHNCRSVHEAAASLKSNVGPWMTSLFEEEGVTWRLQVATYNGSLTAEQQDTCRDHFRAAFPWRGPVRLKDHQCRLPLKLVLDFGDSASGPTASMGNSTTLESCLLKPSSELAALLVNPPMADDAAAGTYDASKPGLAFAADMCTKAGVCTCHPAVIRRAWVGREVLPTARSTVLDTLTLKDRPYLGPTSLDPELAMLMTNLGRVRPHSLVYDPFVGTGSIIAAAAKLTAAAGAGSSHGSKLPLSCLVFGSDVDYKVLRGGESNAKVKPKKATKIARSAEHMEKLAKQGKIATATTAASSPSPSSSGSSLSTGASKFGIHIPVVSPSTSSSTAADGSGCNVFTNFDYYRLSPPELLYLDNAHNNLSNASRPVFDCILADPPYGIREPARKSREKRRRLDVEGDEGSGTVDGAAGASSSAAGEDGSASTVSKERISSESGLSYRRDVWSFDRYEEQDVLFDLLDRSSQLLVKGGRLVYLWPTLAEGHHSSMLPHHPCLQLEFDAEEKLTVMMSRRIVTMVKTSDYEPAKRDSGEYRRAYEDAAERAGLKGVTLKDRLGQAYDSWYAAKTQAAEPSATSPGAAAAGAGGGAGAEGSTPTVGGSTSTGLTAAEAESLIQEMIKISQAYWQQKGGSQQSAGEEAEDKGEAELDDGDDEGVADTGTSEAADGEAVPAGSRADLRALRELRARIAAREGLSKKQAKLLCKKLYIQYQRRIRMAGAAAAVPAPSSK